MKKLRRKPTSIETIKNNLRSLIDHSLQKDGIPLKEWLSQTSRNTNNNCWEKKQCMEKSCPAYMQKKCRCWLVAGTMCGGEIQGVLAKKYRSCTECEVYQDAVFTDSLNEIEEHLIVLVHTLISKQEEINALATTDQLTGLHNRRYFELLIPIEIELMLKNNGVIYITLVDVDGFKHINDSHGHLFGDKILKECASILSKSTRKSDLLVRFGGDEFLIASSCADGDVNAAEQMRQRILDELSLWNRENDYEGFKLSLSMGYSVLKKGIELESAIHEADQNMYDYKRIKSSCRNSQ